MACGTPVVCSNRGALPEIVGAGGLLGAPTAADLAPLVCRLLGDAHLRLELSRTAASQSGRFSWDTTAEVIRQVITSSLDSRRQPAPALGCSPAAAATPTDPSTATRSSE
jgi:glycosyltransferase involved in cell wall biosynthesis